MDKENVKYLNEIESRQYCFDRGELLCVFNDWLLLYDGVDEVEVECLKVLGKNDIITFYHVNVSHIYNNPLTVVVAIETNNRHGTRAK